MHGNYTAGNVSSNTVIARDRNFRISRGFVRFTYYSVRNRPVRGRYTRRSTKHNGYDYIFGTYWIFPGLCRQFTKLSNIYRPVRRLDLSVWKRPPLRIGNPADGVITWTNFGVDICKFRQPVNEIYYSIKFACCPNGAPLLFAYLLNDKLKSEISRQRIVKTDTYFNWNSVNLWHFFFFDLSVIWKPKVGALEKYRKCTISEPLVYSIIEKVNSFRGNECLVFVHATLR